MPASENSFMYNDLPLYFKDLFNQKKVSKVLIAGLLQGFRSTTNDTISGVRRNYQWEGF